MPMEVIDTRLRGGDLRHGYQAVADNLPNDPRIHQEKGTKKLFFKNFMDARVNYVILPIAKVLMPPSPGRESHRRRLHGGHADARNLRTALGRPFRASTASRWISAKPSVRCSADWKKQRPTSSACSRLKWLVDHDAMPKERLEEYYASYLAGIFRTLRFGTGEAARQGRDDGVQLSVRARRLSSAISWVATMWTTRRCRTRSRRWPRNCWRSKPPATVHVPKSCSQNTTPCRRISTTR